MKTTAWIRAAHRWLGIALTLAILANIAAMAFGPPPALITYAPLLPLALLLLTGLQMFFLPIVARRQRSRRQNYPA